MNEYINTRGQIALALPQADGSDAPPVSIDRTSPVPYGTPTVCAECTEEFDASTLLRRRAEGFIFCIGCMIDLEKDGELSTDDRADLAERRYSRGGA